jgi:hypothetical protein
MRVFENMVLANTLAAPSEAVTIGMDGKFHDSCLPRNIIQPIKSGRKR